MWILYLSLSIIFLIFAFFMIWGYIIFIRFSKRQPDAKTSFETMFSNKQSYIPYQKRLREDYDWFDDNISEKLDETLLEFDEIIGLSKLRAIHLNDSLHGFESHKDRHAKIGEGHIGLEGFDRIINHPQLRDLPFFLETPNELDGYEKEIALLKSIYKE